MRGMKSVLASLSLLFIVLASACTTVPVETGRPTAAARQEMQQKSFAQARALFLNKQYTQAAEILLPLAQQGHAGAQYTIGYMYHYGYGVPRNEKESTRWITLAAARGYPQAQAALARINAAHDAQGVLVEPASKAEAATPAE